MIWTDVSRTIIDIVASGEHTVSSIRIGLAEESSKVRIDLFVAGDCRQGCGHELRRIGVIFTHLHIVYAIVKQEREGQRVSRSRICCSVHQRSLLRYGRCCSDCSGTSTIRPMVTAKIVPSTSSSAASSSLSISNVLQLSLTDTPIKLDSASRLVIRLSVLSSLNFLWWPDLSEQFRESGASRNLFAQVAVKS